MCDSSAEIYAKGAASLASFFREHPSLSTKTHEEILTDWVIDMSWQWHTKKTAVHYLDSVSALYTSSAKEGSVEPTKAFRQVKARLLALPEDVWNMGPYREGLKKLLSLAQPRGIARETSPFLDLFLITITSTPRPITGWARLKSSETASLPVPVRNIVGKWIEPKRSYVFPLEQSKKTANQLRRHLESNIAGLLHLHGIPMAGDAENTAQLYRAIANMENGAAAGDAFSTTLPGFDARQTIYQLCQSISDRSENQIAATASNVESLLEAEGEQWFAMHMRQGVRFDSLKMRLSQTDGKKRFADVKLFYPMEEIARKVKNKILYKEVPVLPRIVFFRTLRHNVSPLFTLIGDLAWCYRFGHGYASISNTEMAAFQQAIGVFTPDTHIYPEGTINLEANDRVVILGGALTGHTATVTGLVKGDCCGRIVYRLSLPAGNGIEWTVDIESRQIKKIENTNN